MMNVFLLGLWAATLYASLLAAKMALKKFDLL